MKNFTFLLLFLVSFFANGQVNFPIDFESTPVTTDFTDFDGGTATVLANPESSGINTSATVAQIVRDGGQPWGGSKLLLASTLDFTTNNSFSIKVFSPGAGIPVQLKLEVAGGGPAAERVVNTTVANEWETLTWNFTGEASNTFNEMVFMFDIGTVGNGTASSTFLFDDVDFFDNSGGLAQIDLPINFDDASVFYDLVGFEGNTSEVVVDPTDATNMVGQAIKSNTAETYAGTTMGENGLANPIPLSEGNSKMNVRVWAPDGGIQIRLKVEKQGDPTISVETEATYSVANTWQTLEFDFSNEAAGTSPINYANTYDKISIFFNYGVNGATAGEKTYYWDDVQFGAGSGGGPNLSQLNLPVTFEDTATINYTFIDFDGGMGTVIPNPQSSGINTSGLVGQIVRDGGQPWAGSKLTLANNLDFTSNNAFTMKVFSPAAGIPILLKLEAADGSAAPDIIVNTTVANEWETLTWNYLGTPSNTYNQLVFIFDFGTVGNGTANSTFLFDDIEFMDTSGGLAQVELPITFEDTATVNYDFVDFDGGMGMVIPNPQSSGINTSGLVGQVVRDGGQPWAGSKFVLANNLDFTSNNTFTMKVFSPAAGTPVLLKLEAANGTAAPDNIVNTTVANEWETLTWNYTGTPSNTYNQLVFMFDFGTVGDGSANSTFLFDDVEFIDNSGGLGQVELPITFEDTATVNYSFVNFDGGMGTVIPNPQSSGINTSGLVGQIVRQGGQPWAGSKLILTDNLDFTTNNTFKMKVFSPGVGIPILLKLEGAGVAAPDVIVNTTVAEEWETLTWDYTGTPSNTYNQLVFIFDLGTVGNGTVSSTFLFDDVEFVNETSAASEVDLPITFEDNMIDYNLEDFGGNVSEIVVDPTDSDNLVGQAIKTSGAELWAGTTNGGNGLATAIPFTATETKMTVRVWSPDAGIPIRLKVEAASDPNISVETETNTTIAMGWETLEFDFSNEATGTAALNLANTYDKISIFFNFGTEGAIAGEKTYYWDDIRFGELTSIEILNAADGGIKISPNPTSSFFNIEFPETLKESVQLMLYNVNGQLLKEGKIIDQTSRIDVSDLNAGIYILRMNKGEIHYFQKIIVSK